MVPDYSRAEKRRIRNLVWSWLLPIVNPLTQVLLLPGPLNEEIDLVLQRWGVKESNLHLVDSNREYIHRCARRYPKAATYFGSLDKYLINYGPRLSAAHFDFCAQLDASEVRNALLEARNWTPQARLAVTVFNGHDPIAAAAGRIWTLQCWRPEFKWQRLEAYDRMIVFLGIKIH